MTTDKAREIAAGLSEALPRHEAGLSLTHNEHKNYHYTAQQEIESNPDYYDDESFPSGEREKCIAANELWTLQWYPDTPVGFNVIHASTLEAILVAVRAVLMEGDSERRPRE